MRAFDIQTDLRVELLLLRIEGVIYRYIEYRDSNALGLWLRRLLEVVFRQRGGDPRTYWGALSHLSRERFGILQEELERGYLT